MRPLVLAALLLAPAAAARVLDPEAPPFVESEEGIRGVHLTGWTAGSPKARRAFIQKVKRQGLTAVVIGVKDYDGFVFVKGARGAAEAGVYVNAIPDLAACVRDFKEAGLYTVARIALFKDNALARKRRDWAIRRPDGRLWTTTNGAAWVDPYRREVWEYNLEIAEKAAAAGFDEIQFDYVRFPSDGPTRLCRYSREDHDARTASEAIKGFLTEARDRLRPLGVNTSVCLFGLTTSVDSGMGIGQHMEEIAGLVDYVMPMMYPSHYNKGEYGLKDPNRQPYRTILLGLEDAARRLGDQAYKLRPYLQDFSHGVHYGRRQVRAQIEAAEKTGVRDWMFWNPQNRYTWSALGDPDRGVPPKEASR